MINEIEKNISKKFQQLNLTNFFRFFSSIIEFNKIVIILLFLYLKKYINYRHVKNFLIGIFIVIIFKNFFKRERPFVSHNDIQNLDIKYFDEFSFPSGHSFAAFFIAFTLSCYFNNNIYIKNIFIIIAFTVAISRVYLGVHYLSDITFSLLLARYLAYRK